jgi:hypothetical protein
VRRTTRPAGFHTAHLREDAAHFVAGQHDRQPLGTFRAFELVDGAQFQAEDFLVQKHERTQRLIVRGRGHLAMHGEMVEELPDFGFPHVFGMPFVVKQDEPFRPLHVRFLGANRVVFRPNHDAKLVERLERRG